MLQEDAQNQLRTLQKVDHRIDRTRRRSSAAQENSNLEIEKIVQTVKQVDEYRAAGDIFINPERTVPFAANSPRNKTKAQNYASA